MKPHVSISLRRRAVLATSFSFLIGAATLAAQSSSSNSRTGSDNSSSANSSYQSNNSGSSNSSGTYNSEATPGSSSSYGSASASGSAADRDHSWSRASTTSSSDKLSWGDRRFVTKAAEGGQAEVQVAQLAAERATNPDVKQFAEKLVTDHTKANAELTSLASAKNVKVDQDNDKDHAYKKLEKKSGNDFDREFVEEMVDDHEKDIKMFEKAASDAKDAEVRNFASKTLPTLREHLQIVEGLRSSVMPTGREDSSSGRNLDTTGSTTSSTTSGSYNAGSTSGSSTNNSSSVNGTTGTSNQTSGSSSTGTDDTSHRDSTH